MTLAVAPAATARAHARGAREDGRRPERGAATAAADAFVEGHLRDARALGRDLADLVHEPAALAAAAAAGMRRLADPVYRDAQSWVAPGSANVIGVRAPLQRAVWGAFRRRTRGVRPSSLVHVADALLREGTTELRIFAIDLLTRLVATEPELAWQLLRRAARDAREWITVDTLARAYATGLLAEPYRWAELEQLVYSPSRWERRLVGSTIATLPSVDRTAGRRPEVAARGLALVRELIGDDAREVRAALGWALRRLATVDPAAVVAFCRAEAATAAAGRDGHRAGVLRDALPALAVHASPGDAAELAAALAGIRTARGAAATSRASGIARSFALPADPTAHPEPPLR